MVEIRGRKGKVKINKPKSRNIKLNFDIYEDLRELKNKYEFKDFSIAVEHLLRIEKRVAKYV